MKRLMLLFCTVILMFTTGCADSKRPISLALSPSGPQSIDQGQSLTVSATLTNDSKNQGVTWAISGAGTLSGQTATSVTYAAPSSGASSSTTTITATSVSQTQITATLTVTVNPPPKVNSPALPDASVGTAYSQTTIAGSGGSGALTYSINSGALPAGLALNPSTGAITGTPTGGSGTSTFTVRVTDTSAAGAESAVSGTLSIKVTLPAGPAINTNSLPSGVVGVAYDQPISATGGIAPLSYSISAGALPAGLNIGASSGIITGTPTTQGGATFTVKVSDSSTPTPQTATRQFTILISPSISITTSSLPNGTVGTAYNSSLSEAGGVSPFSWTVTVGSLPAGLSLNNATGAITGTPTSAGTANFTAQVVDNSSPHQSATKALSITIAANTAGLCDPTNTGSESLLHGQYAMLVQGFNSVGTAIYGATFDADGQGHIGKTVGILDTNNNFGTSLPLDAPIDSTKSSYSVGADHRGCMNIVTAAGTLPLRFSLSTVVSGVATKGHVIETGVGGFEFGSGTMELQDASAFSTSKLSGKYAFGIASNKSNGEKYGAVGIFHLDGSGGLSGQIDSNNGSELNGGGSTFPTNALAFSSGSYTVASNGRGTMSFTATGGSQQTAIVYVVSSSSFLLMSSALQSASPLFKGSATLQTGAPFSNSSLNATSVFGTSGLVQTLPYSTVVRVGRLLPGSSPTLSYIENSDGTFSAPTVSTTFSVDSAGRSVFQGPGGNYAVAYLSAPNQGYLLFMIDPIANTPDRTVSSGQFWPQTGAPYSDPALGGDWSYGSDGADSNQSNHRDGFAQFTATGTSGKDTISGAEDFATPTTNIFNQPYSLSLFYTASNGQLDWRDNNLTQIRLGYFISPKTAIAIDNESAITAPVLLFFEAQ